MAIGVRDGEGIWGGMFACAQIAGIILGILETGSVLQARGRVLIHGGQDLGIDRARRAERLVEDTTRGPCRSEH